MALRKLTAAEVTFEVYTQPDDINEREIRGSFATDEPDLDKQQADEIIRRLNDGDETAWCGVVVKATWEHDGVEYTGRDSIWHCTLGDDYTAETVAEHHGMRDNALDDLNRTLEAAVTRGSKLARTLRARKAS